MTTSRRVSQRRAPDLPSPWWGVLMLLGLVAGVILLALGAYYLWVLTAPPEVRVPDVNGINLRAAEQVLARRGLLAQVAAYRYHERAPQGAVISSSPPPGKTVRRGRTVELVVSDGPPWVRMPDLRELDLSQAREAIADADLRLARITRRYSDSVPSGWVLDQKPQAGVRVARRESVQLVVSAGPRPQPSTTAPPAPARHAVVEVTLPPGDRPALVRIEVEDERGVSVPYSAYHDPGSTITQVVTGYGEATARVYVDDKLIEEKRF